MLEGLKLIRLNSETNILPFDCKDADLNGFLFDDAKKHSENLIAVTYILQDDKNTVAYFNYLNDKISHTDIGGEKSLELFAKRVGTFLPIGKGDYKSYPAVKIGRLAVNESNQIGGIGRMIIDYTKNNFIINNKTGCKFITVDAYRKSLGFYEKMGFRFLSSRDKNSDTRLMYFNLESLT
ncbi:GNAT family N-acetyltransferase [Arenibacter algicola]|uniref:GNAT family N-acetyltransferase n=1 Tax=Arenibacter algicola TaxID=616991 RepID=UPI000B8E8D3A|nr:GNAT family N-acetyltransferase [Arenibacter algicola]